ncbi:TnsA endonuclease N-terminal domain-containing protein [Aneurinibacillus sp. Ricciae_BoGa-3]|uniref:TnsA endonuclease N-terminal domain-containing protein n=1 Tax=Aneurinibacillus sp. Ricciae_BoGa-3 TaxID=3022697 RepID=UPI0023407050|nr:TnsA endonuclease N-terminal domain-containing protein [Aneurinibacillus sp. Ricciae_BoGa-3]WCK56230.1 TnsA endonuclease N-terminal domain-containing protein [Aneurinibacillus sp. Ricciae_BoGa-3]
MSDLETNYFYLLDWSDYITDIREQFPLDREITLRIAETKGIKHPIDTKSQTPVVMTSDFLLSGYRNGKEFVVVRTIKPSDKLDNPRTIAKFEIERAYWEEKGINWGIVTEKEIPKTFVNNVKWVHQALRLDGSHGVDSGNITIYSDRLKRHLLNDKCSMRTILNRLDEETNAPAGTFLFVLKHLIATKEVAIKMNDKFVIKNRPQDMIENIKFAVEEEKTII